MTADATHSRGTVSAASFEISWLLSSAHTASISGAMSLRGIPAAAAVAQLVFKVLIAHRIAIAAARRLVDSLWILPSAVVISTAAATVAKLRRAPPRLCRAAPTTSGSFTQASVNCSTPALPVTKRGGDGVLHADLRLRAGRNIRPVGADAEQRIAGHHHLSPRPCGLSRRQSSTQSSTGWITKPHG